MIKKSQKLNKLLSIFALLLAVALLFVVAVGCNPSANPADPTNPTNPTNPADPNDGAEVYALADGVTVEYLAEPFESGEDYIDDNRMGVTQEAHDYQPFAISWDGSVPPYTVEFSTDGADSDIFVTDETSLSPGVLLPDAEYSARVTDGQGGVIVEKKFRTEKGVRWITAREDLYGAGASNVRDLGGWSAEDKHTAYGKIYRGSKLTASSSSTAAGYDYSNRVLAERLGLKTEIDLRGARDDGGQTESPVEGCGYLKAPITGYTSIYSSEVYDDSVYYDEDSPTSFKAIFDLLADESNYPIYFHCRVGKDRTGTLAYLIGAVLGVSYEDLTRDFELSSLTKAGRAMRTRGFNYYDHSNEYVGHESRAWEKMHEIMMQEYSTDGTLGSAAANYLTSFCGVSQASLDSLKAIMLV